MSVVEQSPGRTTQDEQIHLVPDSLSPLLLAAGLAITIIGLLTWWVAAVLGAVWTTIVAVRWLRQARSDTADIPINS